MSRTTKIIKVTLIVLFALLLAVSLGLNTFMFVKNGWDIKPIVWINDTSYYITQDFFEHRQNLKYDEGYQTGNNTGYKNGLNVGYNTGQKSGESIGYVKGFDAGQKFATPIAYNQGYEEGRSTVSCIISNSKNLKLEESLQKTPDTKNIIFEGEIYVVDRQGYDVGYNIGTRVGAVEALKQAEEECNILLQKQATDTAGSNFLNLLGGILSLFI